MFTQLTQIANQSSQYFDYQPRPTRLFPSFQAGTGNDTRDLPPKGKPDDAAIPHLDVPVTLSILASNSLHPDIYSPVGTLIIPFYRRIVRNGYFLVIGVELLTAMLVKWALSTSTTYIAIPGTNNQSLPNINAFGQTRINLFDNAEQEDLLRKEIFQSPLIPTRGLTINLTLSAPVHAVQSIAGAAYSFELKAIENAPGYLIPVILVLLYFLLAPYYRSKTARHKEQQE